MCVVGVPPLFLTPSFVFPSPYFLAQLLCHAKRPSHFSNFCPFPFLRSNTLLPFQRSGRMWALFHGASRFYRLHFLNFFLNFVHQLERHCATRTLIITLVFLVPNFPPLVPFYFTVSHLVRFFAQYVPAPRTSVILYSFLLVPTFNAETI